MAFRIHLQSPHWHPFTLMLKVLRPLLRCRLSWQTSQTSRENLLSLCWEADIYHDVAMLTPVGLFTSLTPPPTIESHSLRKSKGRREWISIEGTCMYSPMLTYLVGWFSVALFAQNLRGVIPSAQKMPAEHTGLENSVRQGPRSTDTARSAVMPHGRKIRCVFPPQPWDNNDAFFKRGVLRL